MLVALYVMAGIFAVLMVATIAVSGDRLAMGIKGTLRYGVLGTAVVLPIAAALAVLGLCIYAFVVSVLYVLDKVK